MKKLFFAFGAILILITALVLFFNAAPNAKSTTIQTKTTQAYDAAEVAKHNSKTSCWMIVSGKIYDVTSYIDLHPNDQILKGCGNEATTMFNSEKKHKGQAQGILNQYYLADLK